MSTAPDRSLLRPGSRVVVAGTHARGRRPSRYYAGPGNRFWELAHASGLVPERLDPDRADELLAHGVGLTDLVLEQVRRAGHEPERVIHHEPFDQTIRDVGPLAVAFVSKTAATWYARGARLRLPHRYGEPDWTVADGVPTFVLPGPSGANNAMSVPLRTALWADLVDFLDHLEHERPGSRGRPPDGDSTRNPPAGGDQRS